LSYLYWSRTPDVFRPLPLHGFLVARLVPVRQDSDAWLISGSVSAYLESEAEQVAETALKLGMKRPELARRNPKSMERAWKQMRDDRAAFVELFGAGVGSEGALGICGFSALPVTVRCDHWCRDRRPGVR
jgi:hypothetical protein